MSLAAMRMHSREEFQTWLAQDLDVREELYGVLDTELDVDVPSLEQLEAFLLRRYPGPDAILALDQRGIADAAARHVGRVLVLNVDDAVWDIDLDNEKNVCYRLPVVRMSDGLEACPLTMVTASLDRRTGHFLRDTAEALQDAYNGDDSDGQSQQ
ncbi:hypothetical protein ONA91_32620 [Micromonospora sp. DR5-3]|uniref:hypothetical protein n=1 Tax=unclassified Micromonospora TaxID=2617518 RepID=UPI0011DBA4B1|nr:MULTISPECIES: hypothetical protein [unclassified Micromonospora]MCW3819196.1 hypothetical protein [Micromonospora sp. DR5-3]TYC20726.1 hypothetical protein FXF52_29645 [Micromonospora sp. MP36]